jgi:hypothetical protein
MRASPMVVAMAVTLANAALGHALAQNAGSQPPTQGPGMDPIEAPPFSGPQAGTELRAPVLKITSVEIIRTAHEPVIDIVRVRGMTSSPGWEEGELVPLTRSVPADGVLQLVFIARAPPEAAEASAFEPIEAIFPLETNHGFKGVNVHGAVDAIEVNAIPGYSESKSTLSDCGKCIGKLFVARSAAASGGKSGADVVREEQIAPNARIIRPGDGISGPDSNPNRLTLILNKDGRIASAVWE